MLEFSGEDGTGGGGRGGGVEDTPEELRACLEGVGISSLAREGEEAAASASPASRLMARPVSAGAVRRLESQSGGDEALLRAETRAY